MVAWFDKIKRPRIALGGGKTKIPEGLWVKCDKCKEIIFKNELKKILTSVPNKVVIIIIE